MGLSRWGDRVEKLANEPVPVPTVSEQITLAAARVEVEATIEYIVEWMARHLQMFPGLVVKCAYNASCAWYVLDVSVTVNGQPGRAILNLREELVYEAAESTMGWRGFMDGRVRMVRDLLRADLKRAGIAVRADVPADIKVDFKVDMEAFKRGAAAAGQSTRDFARAAEQVTRAFSTLATEVDAQEEAEAVESIKRTIAGQA